MPGCCDPYCCVKTKPTVIKTINYLEDTFRKMQTRDRLEALSLQGKGSSSELKDNKEQKRMEPFQKFNPNLVVEFPTKGPLGLTEAEREAIFASWQVLYGKHVFLITDYLKLVFAREDMRKPFLIPKKIPEGQDLADTSIFQRHVLLQHISYQAFMDHIVSAPDKLIKVCQELGLRHQRFKSVVKFEPYVWKHLSDCFMEALGSHLGDQLTSELKTVWMRFLYWVFTHMNMAFYYGSNYSY